MQVGAGGSKKVRSPTPSSGILLVDVESCVSHLAPPHLATSGGVTYKPLALCTPQAYDVLLPTQAELHRVLATCIGSLKCNLVRIVIC